MEWTTGSRQGQGGDDQTERREEIQGSTNRDRRETISSKECVGQAQRPDERPDQERKQFCRLGRLPQEMVKGWPRAERTGLEDGPRVKGQPVPGCDAVGRRS